MQYVKLGRCGVKVSRLCLGTMNFGPQQTEEESHKLMSAAIHELGINFFDTADIYGGIFNRDQEPRRGWTEEIIGRWIKSGAAPRDQLVLATKCYLDMGSGPNGRGLSAYHIRRACEASLKRMQVDHIDLYQMHHVDRAVPWDEIWQAMEQLVREGKITYVGSSNFAGWDIATACQTARARNFLGPVSEQSVYALSRRTIELEVLPACKYYGLGVIAWSPLAGGLLGGVLEQERVGRRKGGNVEKQIEQRRPQLEKWEGLCKRLGQPPAEVALAWVLHNPVLTAPIIGPRERSQLDSAVRALDLKLDEATLQEIDQIWPGPGGSAPEAYAW
ncbi:MAG: aldo/keto reductase [Phycisphaeraceae bacterium]|nr:aldo/keto reductase [Phycisphaeraceae bacterium]